MRSIVAGCCIVLAVAAPRAGGAAEVDYLRDIKPLLMERCVACHGGLRQKNRLRLDTAELARQGGQSGPAVVAGQSDESLLIDAVLGNGVVPAMPPEGEGEKLSPEQVAMLRAWIDAGAPAPPETPMADPRQHWAYRVPERPAVPAVSQSERVRNPIDAFILAELEARGLEQGPEADRGTLLRRVTIDLTGLAPTREELQAFLADTDPQAYEKAVDRLLASPRYAERWARHWMDVWRYSDWYGSRGGNELRNSRRHIWRWRDWIIESLESDRPYAEMVQDMLAADELAPGDLERQRALGFLGRNYYVFNRHVWLHDTVEFTGMALLGTTFKCARCHDHKYDPISQEEYFRLKAVFEPHQVRVDRLPARMELLKGQWPAMGFPGAALAEGTDVVYDADPAAKTQLLIRGDEKLPDPSRTIDPGVPAVMRHGGDDLAVAAVALPAEVYYPELRADLREDLRMSATEALARAEDELRAKTELVARVEKEIEGFAQGAAPDPAKTAVLYDVFAERRSDLWTIRSGDWNWRTGKLVGETPGHFSTVLCSTVLPEDLQGRVRYRTRAAGMYRSVGFAFDVAEDVSSWQAVYTATDNTTSTVQAFHRQGGREEYPAAGIVNTPIKIDEEVTIDFAVRGPWLNVWVNEELKLVYRMPLARKGGRFALWTHTGTAEFYEVRIEPLAETTAIVEAVQTGHASPLAAVSREMLEKSLERSRRAVLAGEAQVLLRRAELASVTARIEAELARYSSPVPANVEELAKVASRAERELNVVKARQGVAAAEKQLQVANDAVREGDEKSRKAVTDAEAAVAAAVKVREGAEAALQGESAQYTPLGTLYPRTSSGRRLAFARWVTRRENPLTARVAVNHIWLRHFGAGLVASPHNLGMNGKRPTHPALLDWLAVEFMEQGWRMKPLHRLMVTSRTYRLASGMSGSGAGGGDSSQAHDAENRWYGRANVRRMEAEVVRDSLLYLAGELATDRGGPELDPAAAETVLRRSLYFRHTPDDRAAMLELFDAANATECYVRDESIIPQQALVLSNSAFSFARAKGIAARQEEKLGPAGGTAEGFVTAAFEHLLSRAPTDDERRQCAAYLEGAWGTAAGRRRAESLVHVLLNYNEFVTVR